jgi:hypothetical protein
MNYYKVKTTDIDYYITYEDINFDPWDSCFNAEEDMDEAERQADEEIARIRSELPQELELEIECDPEDLDDMVCEAISDETGWLVNYFNYDILETKAVED